MEHYRLYIYDPAGGLDRVLGLECRGDAHAVDMLHEHATRHPLMELWHHRRLLASYGTNPIDARLALA